MAFDPLHLQRLTYAPVVDALGYMREQVAASSLDRQWPGLLVWRQQGGPGELYVPPVMHHTVIVKLGSPNASRQVRASRQDGGVLHASEKGLYWATGDAAIVPAGEAGYWHTDAMRDNLHILIEPDLLLRHAARRAPASVDVMALERRFNVRDERLRLMALLLLNVLEQPSDGDPLFMASLSETLAAHLLTHYTRFLRSPVGAPRLTNAQLQQITDFIESQLSERLTLERIADVACLSPWHFARCFKQSTGQSPHRYLTQRRMQRALALLSTTDWPVIDIALEVGFPDPAHFSRVFKQEYGVSPQTYRQGA